MNMETCLLDQAEIDVSDVVIVTQLFSWQYDWVILHIPTLGLGIPIAQTDGIWWQDMANVNVPSQNRSRSPSFNSAGVTRLEVQCYCSWSRGTQRR